MSDLRLQRAPVFDKHPLSALPKEIPPIVHYSAGEPFTKYEMCLIFAKILELPTEHILPEADPPQGEYI